MKKNGLVILYILMLLVGLILPFTNKTADNASTAPAVTVPEPPKEKEIVEYDTIAIARVDIDKSKIITSSDYEFKTIEKVKGSGRKDNYIRKSENINQYVAKNYIQKDTIISSNYIAAPNSSDYIKLSLQDGMYLFPINLVEEDVYLVKNLDSGDLVDIYVVYGTDRNTAQSNDPANIALTSPGQYFLSSQVKPIIVGKKILFIDSGASDKNTVKKEIGKLNIALNKDEIVLLRTLMANAKVVIYPSELDAEEIDGLKVLDESEKQWPLSEKSIFNRRVQVSKLRGQ